MLNNTAWVLLTLPLCCLLGYSGVVLGTTAVCIFLFGLAWYDWLGEFFPTTWVRVAVPVIAGLFFAYRLG